ncbi:MAG TPA: redoxin domain-containing protein [Verrucomicrobiae bacterium]|nr:redoxin domain-containing protein [Verrucomicrobiae bacterium]
MKQMIALLGAIALASSAFAAAEVGKPAPDFTGTDINGKTVNLSDYKGKIVVLESYNQDCPYCHNQFRSGAMQELQKEMTAKGVVWLMVNSVNPHNSSHRTPEEARAEWKDQKLNATAWIDDSSGKIGHLYAMKTTPHMFVIDKNGVLVYDGAIDDQPDPDHNPREAHNYVRAAIDQITSGEKVTVSQTKPYGCAVKYGG